MCTNCKSRLRNLAVSSNCKRNVSYKAEQYCTCNKDLFPLCLECTTQELTSGYHELFKNWSEHSRKSNFSSFHSENAECRVRCPSCMGAICPCDIRVLTWTDEHIREILDEQRFPYTDCYEDEFGGPHEIKTETSDIAPPQQHSKLNNNMVYFDIDAFESELNAKMDATKHVQQPQPFENQITMYYGNSAPVKEEFVKQEGCRPFQTKDLKPRGQGNYANKNVSYVNQNEGSQTTLEEEEEEMDKKYIECIEKLEEAHIAMLSFVKGFLKRNNNKRFKSKAASQAISNTGGIKNRIVRTTQTNVSTPIPTTPYDFSPYDPITPSYINDVYGTNKEEQFTGFGEGEAVMDHSLYLYQDPLNPMVKEEDEMEGSEYPYEFKSEIDREAYKEVQVYVNKLKKKKKSTKEVIRRCSYCRQVKHYICNCPHAPEELKRKKSNKRSHQSIKKTVKQENKKV
jgi:hypothetical protein